MHAAGAQGRCAGVDAADRGTGNDSGAANADGPVDIGAAGQRDPGAAGQNCDRYMHAAGGNDRGAGLFHRAAGTASAERIDAGAARPDGRVGS